MIKKIYKLIIVPLIGIVLFTNTRANFLPGQPYDLIDPSGSIGIIDPDVNSLGGYSEDPDGLVGLEQKMPVLGMLARQDYQAIYDQAIQLLQTGETFRKTEIQAPYEYQGTGDYPAGSGYINQLTFGTMADALRNYADFNDGYEFFSFCSDYSQVDEQGYCPESVDWRNIRNQLVRARELFAYLSSAEPANASINQGSVREIGVGGVLTTTRELVYIHSIFGNEFLIDAVDYRFSVGEIPPPDTILLQEIGQLNLALKQYILATDIFAHALNADYGGPNGIYLGEYFTGDDIELFAITTERLVNVLDELALRYRVLGQDEQAWALYSQAATDQYIKALAVAMNAAQNNEDFYNNGGQRLITNIYRLRAMAQAIREGLNPFGFPADYVPVNPYIDLRDFTKTWLLTDAENDEDAARDAQRTFDQLAFGLFSEYQALRDKYDSQLNDLCGVDIQTCEGGLMGQNLLRLEQAHTQIRLANQRMEAIPQKISIEQQRAGKVINLILTTGEQVAALDYTISLYSSYSVSVGGSIGFSTGSGGGFSFSGSASRSWNPYRRKIADAARQKALLQAAERAQIEGANSEAYIRNLLLEQADLIIELDLAVQEYNRILAERNQLVGKYEFLTTSKGQAQTGLLSSYFNKPSYRLIRESQTIQAVKSHELAAQFAYLTAKALEYELLTPIPFIDDIFKARTADDIDNFLIALEQWRFALGDELNSYPKRISIAEDILGYTDEYLDPNGTMTPAQRAEMRYQLFQQYLLSHIDQDREIVEFQFTTSLPDSNLFSQNVWNNRIAGVNKPVGVPGTNGVSINLLTRQLGDIDTPEVILVHEGQTTYRNIENEYVHYTVGRAVLIGYVLPPGFTQIGTTAVILSSVNDNGEGIPNGSLYNLSVAASSWRLKLDLTSPYNDELDISKLEDIEILLSTTAYALPQYEAEALSDSRRMIAEFNQPER